MRSIDDASNRDEAFSPLSGPSKAVTIAEEPETISPSIQPNGGSPILQGVRPPKQHRTSFSSRKLTGRPSYSQSSASLHSLTSQISNFKLDSPESEDVVPEQTKKAEDPHALLTKVVNWLHEEKAKRLPKTLGSANRDAHTQVETQDAPNLVARSRNDSQASEGALALERLEQILTGYAARGKEKIKEKRSTHSMRRPSSFRKFKRGSTAAASSDTEYQDGDIMVPNVEAVLDNSKTMAFTGGGSVEELDAASSAKRPKDKQHWNVFKMEIVRLTHTLRLKGWRRVPMERGGDINVERLSGALTNAVYVVSPPKNLLQGTDAEQDGITAPTSRKPPPKLLLRVYGPQVEHLIDRESELAILRRLSRKRIGPRLLGTFSNGRFEEFFYARTLTAKDLRVPETSKQIAKRMRELHDGIELLEEEREGGPFVWNNWDKWIDRCEQVVSWVDKEILASRDTAKSGSESWKQRGLVCGVRWPVFRQIVEKYRKQLDNAYGGSDELKKQLVFAHNDTQYGNLLRLQPKGESPLLHPANEHKQLVVIDFEYASANTPGVEFANHFTEWCYNYHDPATAWACNTKAYPTPEEQHRFISSYVNHRPQYHPKASATPATTPSAGPTSSISAFMLDSRAPPASYDVEEKAREEATEEEVQRLLKDARLWRVANSAMWVAWGVVQAKVEGMEEGIAKAEATKQGRGAPHGKPLSDPLEPEVAGLAEDAHHDRPESRAKEEANEEGDVEDDKEFDYLAYAQDRAMFFWGDILALGLMKKEDLPREVLEKIKVVPY